MVQMLAFGGKRVEMVERVTNWLAQQDAGIYLVGGCVRDWLLGRPIADLDVVTAGDGPLLARRLANSFGGDCFTLDRARCTGRAILRGEEGRRLEVDVARFQGEDLTADLALRDFTINAMAVDVRVLEAVIDPFDGLADLEAGRIRPVSDGSIRNDPLRAMRALRLAAQLHFILDAETEALIRRDGAGLAQVAGERVRDELASLIDLPHASQYLARLDELGLLTIILPELEALRNLAQPLPHHLDALDHSMATVSALEALLEAMGEEEERAGGRPEPAWPDWPMMTLLSPFSERVCFHVQRVMSDSRSRLVTLKLAALLHDVSKPETRAVDEDGRIRFLGHQKVGAEVAAGALRRLRFSGSEVRLAETVVEQHMRPLLLASENSVTSRAIYRFFRDTGEAGVEVLLHALADHQATYAPEAEDSRWLSLVELAARMLGDYWDRRPKRVQPPPLVDGHDLMREFGLEPGPHIGEMLEMVREAQVAGKVKNRQGALSLLRTRLSAQS
jgi:poly(A) polymerase/tRNA nucleotidyltransferase (CCA-adding enzyme)